MHAHKMENKCDLKLEIASLEQRIIEENKDIERLTYLLKREKLEASPTPSCIIKKLKENIGRMSFEDHAHELFEILYTLSVHAVNNPNFQHLAIIEDASNEIGHLEELIGEASEAIEDHYLESYNPNEI